MTPRLRLDVHGAINNDAHNQDWYVVEEGSGLGVLVAVADGVSSAGSDGAARAVIEIVSHCYREHPSQDWCTYSSRLLSELNRNTSYGPTSAGKTTLTVAWIQVLESACAVVQFLAIGDSPIYIAYEGPIAPSFPDTFLVEAIHAKPLQVQNSGRIYSYVDCELGRIIGRVAKGSVELRNNDVCLVCTDGVPIKGEMILNDLKAHTNKRHRFLNRVYSKGSKLATEWLFREIAKRGGFPDDATLVTILVTDKTLAVPRTPAVVAFDAAIIADVAAESSETNSSSTSDDELKPVMTGTNSDPQSAGLIVDEKGPRDDDGPLSTSADHSPQTTGDGAPVTVPVIEKMPTVTPAATEGTPDSAISAGVGTESSESSSPGVVESVLRLSGIELPTQSDPDSDPNSVGLDAGEEQRRRREGAASASDDRSSGPMETAHPDTSIADNTRDE